MSRRTGNNYSGARWTHAAKAKPTVVIRVDPEVAALVAREQDVLEVETGRRPTQAVAVRSLLRKAVGR